MASSPPSSTTTGAMAVDASKNSILDTATNGIIAPYLPDLTFLRQEPWPSLLVGLVLLFFIFAPDYFFRLSEEEDYADQVLDDIFDDYVAAEKSTLL